jgi:SAM-dependent methyltransferase
MISETPAGLRLPPVTPELARNFTWRYYYSGEFPFAKRTVRHVRWRRFAAALELLRGVTRPRLLVDAGCGPGESTVFLLRELGGEGALGLDISPDCCFFANRLAAANGLPARFVVASAARLPLRDGEADLVVSFETIEHMPNWREFFGEARRVLVPGGHLLVTTPNARSLHSGLKALYRKARRFEHLNRRWRKDGDFYEAFLPDSTMIGALRSTGFELAARRHVAFVLTVQPDWTLGLSRRLERWLERLPGVRRLAVTSVLLARAI